MNPADVFSIPLELEINRQLLGRLATNLQPLEASPSRPQQWIVSSSENPTDFNGHSDQLSAVEETTSQSPTTEATEATVDQLAASNATEGEGSPTTVESRNQLSAAEVVDGNSSATETIKEQSSVSGGASSPELAITGGAGHQTPNSGSNIDSNASESGQWVLFCDELPFGGET